MPGRKLYDDLSAQVTNIASFYEGHVDGWGPSTELQDRKEALSLLQNFTQSAVDKAQALAANSPMFKKTKEAAEEALVVANVCNGGVTDALSKLTAQTTREEWRALLDTVNEGIKALNKGVIDNPKFIAKQLDAKSAPFFS